MPCVGADWVGLGPNCSSRLYVPASDSPLLNPNPPRCAVNPPRLREEMRPPRWAGELCTGAPLNCAACEAIKQACSLRLARQRATRRRVFSLRSLTRSASRACGRVWSSSRRRFVPSPRFVFRPLRLRVLLRLYSSYRFRSLRLGRTCFWTPATHSWESSSKYGQRGERLNILIQIFEPHQILRHYFKQ